MTKNKITFFYPSGPVLTGQELASRLILEILEDTEYYFKTVKLPGFDRERPCSFKNIFVFPLHLANVWFHFLSLIFKRKPIAYLNLGQSLKALICDGLPLYLSLLLRSEIKSVVSLHGQFFLDWKTNDLRLSLLILILKKVSLVTVLDIEQKDKLIKLGIFPSRLRIINNTCENIFENTSKPPAAKKDHINLLYLSNLIQAKGYKTYLLALLEISCMPNFTVPVNAVLCGKLMNSSFDKSNGINHCNDEHWIYQTIESINSSKFVKVSWIKGAYGNEKASLFSDADIFVYPSLIDAQPIALIEAMATSCAIVCSDVGGIPAMVGESAMMLHNVTVDEITDAIVCLVTSDNLRIKLSKACNRRFKEYFSRKSYASQWYGIFLSLTKGINN